MYVCMYVGLHRAGLKIYIVSPPGLIYAGRLCIMFTTAQKVFADRRRDLGPDR